MKKYSIKILLVIVLVLLVTIPLQASEIQYNDMISYHDKNYDISFMDPSVIGFLKILVGKSHEKNLADVRSAQISYDQKFVVSGDHDQKPPTPVPKSMSLILFGTGMLGVANLINKRANN